jgi:hypothetical protein
MRDARARTGPPRNPGDGTDRAAEGNRSAKREGRQAPPTVSAGGAMVVIQAALGPHRLGNHYEPGSERTSDRAERSNGR